MITSQSDMQVTNVKFHKDNIVIGEEDDPVDNNNDDSNDDNNGMYNDDDDDDDDDGDDDDLNDNDIEFDEIGVSTVGKRKQKFPSKPTMQEQQQQQQQQQQQFIEEDFELQQQIHKIIQNLTNDSDFFDQNTPRILPEFSSQEIKIGQLLGEGEFGTVCQIESFQKQLAGCGCKTLCGNRPSTKDATTAAAAAAAATLTTPTTNTTSAVVAAAACAVPASTCCNNNKTIQNEPSPTKAVTINDDDDLNNIVPIPIVGGDKDNDDGDVSDLDDGDNDNDNDDSNGNGNDNDNFENFEMDGEAEYMRDYLIHHVYRCGQYRYAIKQVRRGIQNYDNKMEAAIDMIMETKILSCLGHPNIVKVRAIMGTFGKPDDFGMIMDRLNETLRGKISKEWPAEVKAANANQRSFLNRIAIPIPGWKDSTKQKQQQQQQRLDELFEKRLYALYDIARALRHLHRKNILYRDLKPENVGVNLRGEYLIFDFGLAKELKQKDLVEPPDGFQATGLTGSRRYMAPEVIYCKNYGFSADVYSYAIVFWETMALKIPFRSMSLDLHFEQVVMKGKRPKVNDILRKKAATTITTTRAFPKSLQTIIMEHGWDADPSKRPTFETICEILKTEITIHKSKRREGGGEGSIGKSLEDRTNDLMNLSEISRTESIKECC